MVSRIAQHALATVSDPRQIEDRSAATLVVVTVVNSVFSGDTGCDSMYGRMPRMPRAILGFDPVGRMYDTYSFA